MIVLVLDKRSLRVVLYPLQLVDGAGWSAVEHSVAVVDPGKAQTTYKRLCEVRKLVLVLEMVHVQVSVEKCCTY